VDEAEDRAAGDIEIVCSMFEAVVETTWLYPTTNGASDVGTLGEPVTVPEPRELLDGDVDDWYIPRRSSDALVGPASDEVPFPDVPGTVAIPAEEVEFAMIVDRVLLSDIGVLVPFESCVVDETGIGITVIVAGTNVEPAVGRVGDAIAMEEVNVADI